MDFQVIPIHIDDSPALDLVAAVDAAALPATLVLDDPDCDTADEADDCAIATDKAALVVAEGLTATFANYTTFDKGINGTMVDVMDLADPAGLGTADFVFRVGNSDNPDDWDDLPDEIIDQMEVSVREGAGDSGSDRLTIIFPDHEIQNVWLEVTVLTTANTGLAVEDVTSFAFLSPRPVLRRGLLSVGGQFADKAVGAVLKRNMQPQHHTHRDRNGRCQEISKVEGLRFPNVHRQQHGHAEDPNQSHRLCRD